jgi:hypothetical protein
MKSPMDVLECVAFGRMKSPVVHQLQVVKVVIIESRDGLLLKSYGTNPWIDDGQDAD